MSEGHFRFAGLHVRFMMVDDEESKPQKCGSHRQPRCYFRLSSSGGSLQSDGGCDARKLRKPEIERLDSAGAAAPVLGFVASCSEVARSRVVRSVGYGCENDQEVREEGWTFGLPLL